MIPRLGLLLSTSLALTLAACGGSSSGDFGGPMVAISCSLGCSSTGAQIKCGTTQVFVNQDLWFEFSQPVDLSTVTKNTLQVTNTSTGQTPAGTYIQDPTNPRRIAFRPLLSFDSLGNPIFGFQPNSVFRVTVPGQASGDNGPFLRSQAGEANQQRIDCFVSASLGINDLVPGPPTVVVTLEDLAGAQPPVEAQGAEDVPRQSRVRLVFDDIMNPSTLVNPATGLSPLITVALDLDGDLATTDDQLLLQGAFQISFDFLANTTTVLFTPTGGFPSSGSDPDSPRRIVMNLPVSISDLGGNGLVNAGPVAFTTVGSPLVVGTLPVAGGEQFTSTQFVDTNRTGMFVVTDPGRLVPGLGGGSGKLGDLVVSVGQTVVLSTAAIGNSFGPGADPENPPDFSSVVLDNYDPENDLPGTVDLVAVDGVYEFSSLRVDSGGVLRFSGDDPPRIFVRGAATVQGLIEVPGLDGPVHAGRQGFGGQGGLAGPGGGSGGRGADRVFWPAASPVLLAGAFDFAGQGVDPGILQTTGRPGFGRGGEVGTGGGTGGIQWPVNLPGPTLFPPFADFVPNLFCRSQQVGGPGNGGTFSAVGGVGTYVPLPGPTPPLPQLPAPDPTQRLTAQETDLDPEAGELVGGAGGGGGGLGIAGTATNGQLFACQVPFAAFPIVGPPGLLQIKAEGYRDASGAGGGGGGGTLQLQVGGRLTLQGAINVRGGRGGGGTAAVVQPFSNDFDQDAAAAPGGGGSGGSILVQTRDLILPNLPGLFDVTGGEGGRALPVAQALAIPNLSLGGAGGPGIVRIEKSPLLPLTPTQVSSRVIPLTGGQGQPAVLDVIATADWFPKLLFPEPISEGARASARSGMQSCWLTPTGAFQVEYEEDSEEQPGWNLGLRISGVPVTIPWRGPQSLSLFGFPDLESLFGGDLGTSPIVVRFQGARLLQSIQDGCAVTFGGSGSPFLPGSLTPWVRHPAELNTYWTNPALGLTPGEAAQFKPNAIRYQIVFDRSVLGGGLIEAIDSFEIVCEFD